MLAIFVDFSLIFCKNIGDVIEKQCGVINFGHKIAVF
jgi:hypothetical protein